MAITNISDFKKRQRTEIDIEIKKGHINGYLDYLDNHSASSGEYEEIYEKYVRYLLQECKDDDLCTEYINKVRGYGQALIEEHKEKLVIKAINQFIRNIEKNEESNKTLAVLYSDKSRCYLRGGDMKKAYKNATTSYELNQEALGASASATIRSRIEMSKLLSFMEKTEEAEVELNKIHKESLEFFESDNPEILEILELMINAYDFRQGETEEKTALRKLLYEKSSEILGENHPRTFETMAAMTKAYREKDPDTYITSMKSVYEKAVIQIGSNNPTVWDIMTDLAYAYKQNYCFCEALDLITKVYIMESEEYGRDSKKALRVLTTITEYIADVKSLPKDYKVEQSYYDSLKDDYSEEEMASIIDNLSKMEYALKDYEKTLEIVEEMKNRVLSILEEIKADDQTIYFWMAKAYEGLEEYDKSAMLMEKYYSYMMEEYGENHYESIFTLSELAYSYQMAERWSEATDTFDRAWKQAEDTFGMDDSLTKMMRNSYYYAKAGEEHINRLTDK